MQVVPPVCPTEQCVFDKYSSIAIIPSFGDTTSDLIFREAEINGSSTFVASLKIPDGSNLTLQASSFQVPYLNSSAVDIGNPNTDIESASQRVQLLDLYAIGFNSTNFAAPPYLNGTPAPLNASEVWSRFQAFHCQFHLAAEVHNASVASSHFIDTVVSTTDFWYYNGTYAYTELMSGQMGGISSFGIAGLKGLFWNSFNGSGTSISTDTTSGPSSVSWTNNFVQAIYDNGLENINTTFAGIAQGLTTSLRSQSNQTVPGTAYQQQSFYHARFEFLVLPAILVVATGLLVLVTTIRSQRLKVPAWKTNVIATIVGSRDLLNTDDKAVEVPSDLRLRDLEDWARDKKLVLPNR